MLYAGMGCPTPSIEWLLSPKLKDQLDDWLRIFGRCGLYEVDEHMSKLVRTMAHSKDLTKK